MRATLPSKPPRPCPRPGCGELIEAGDRGCPRHRPKDSIDLHRESSHRRGYDRRWRRKRERVLIEEPVCRIQKLCNGDPAKDVDHIVAKRDGGTDARENLQGACHACHSWKTATVDVRWGRR